MRPSAALKLGRVSNLPTVWTNVLAGFALTGIDTPASLAVATLVALTSFYLGGMYLNDAFDREFDAQHRPERPIPSGEVSASLVFTIGFVLLLLGVVILMVAGFTRAAGTGWPPVVGGLALAAAIVFYDWKHKGNPLSPVVMGICRALIYVIAALMVTTDVSGTVVVGAAALLCYLIGLTYAAKQENLGRIETLWPLVFLVAPFLLIPTVIGINAPAVIALVLFAVWVVFALSHLLRPRHINVPRAVVSLLAGLCLLDASIIAAMGNPLLSIVAGAGLLLTLGLQRWVPGT